MDRKDHINFWLTSAAHDFEVAAALLEKGKNAWCLFIGHLVLEKTLKALYVRDNEKMIPPKIHNLAQLAEKTKLELTPEQKLFLLDVNDFHIEARYPDYKFNFYKTCTPDFTKDNFNKIKDFYGWLLEQIS